MDSALGSGFVQNRRSGHKGRSGSFGVFFLHSKADSLNDAFHTSTDRTVTGGFFQTLLMALDGGFMVSQGKTSKYVILRAL